MKTATTLLALRGSFALAATAGAQLAYTTGLDVWLDVSDIDGSNNSILSDGDPVATWLGKGSTGVNDAAAILTGGSGGTNGVFIAGGGNGPQDAVLPNNTRFQLGREFMDSPNMTMCLMVQRTGGGQGAVFDLRITAAGFNGSGGFVVTVTGLDTAKSCLLTRSADLADGFPVTAFGPFTPASATGTVADPAPPTAGCFYRIEEATQEHESG